MGSWSEEWAKAQYAQQHGFAPSAPDTSGDSGGGFGLMDAVRPLLGWTNTIIEAPYNFVSKPLITDIAKLESSKAVQSNDFTRFLFGVDEERAAKIRDIQKQGGSDKEIYDARFEDNGLGKFAAEAVLDPLNLVGGVGALTKAARAANMANKGNLLARADDLVTASPAVANVLRQVVGLENKINDVQSLPFMAPVRAAKWTGSKLLGGQLEKAGISQYRERMVDLSNFQKELSDKGLDPWEYTASSGDAAYLNPDKMSEALRIVDDPNSLMDDMDDGLLGRTWKTVGNDDKELKSVLTTKLTERGLLTSNGKATGKLKAHMQLDEIADRAGMGIDERQAMKDAVDIITFAAYTSNKQGFKGFADVPVNVTGQDINAVDRMALDQLNNLRGLELKSLDDAYSKIKFYPGEEAGKVNSTFDLNGKGVVKMGIEGMNDAVDIVNQTIDSMFRSLTGASGTYEGRELAYEIASPRSIDRLADTQATAEGIVDEGQQVLGSYVGNTPERAAAMGRLKKFSDFAHMREGGVGAPSPNVAEDFANLADEPTSSEFNPAYDTVGNDAEEWSPERMAEFSAREQSVNKAAEAFPGMKLNPTADFLYPTPKPDPDMDAGILPPEFNLQDDLPHISDPDPDDVIPDPIMRNPIDEIPTTVEPPDNRGVFEIARDNARLSRPKASANVQEVLDQISFEENIPMSAATRVNELLDPVIGQNPEHFAAFNLWGRPKVRENLVRAMKSGSEEEMRDAVARALDYTDNVWSSMGVAHPGTSKLGKLGQSIQGIISQTARTRATQGTRAGGRAASGSILSDSSVEFAKDLRNREAIQKFQSEYDKEREAVEGIIADIAKTKGGLVQPVGVTTTYRDLQEAAKFGTAKQQKRVDKFLKKYNIEEENISDSLNKGYERSLIEAYQKDVAKELGVDWNKTPDGIRAMQKVAKGWRELALLTPRYHLANAMDMMVKSAIHGVNPLKPPGSAQEWTAAMGRSLPTGVRVESVEGVKENPVEFAVASDESVLPGWAGKATEWNSRMARTIENSFRESAFAQGARDWIQNQQWDIFEGEVRRLTGDKADEILGDLRKTKHGISFSPEVLQERVMSATGDVRASTELSRMWDRNITEAYGKGRELANLVHFDFGDVRKIEETLHLRAWAPFHFWATRNIPYYLDTLAANPELIRVWDEYNEYSEADTEGAPGRFDGMVKALGPVDDIIDVLFGPGKSYFNPMVALSIADQTKSRYVDPDMPLLGKGLNKLQSVGLAPAPWFSQAFSAVGIYGAEDEPFNVLRHSGIIKSATGAAGIDPFDQGGLDIEEPFHNAVDRSREFWTGKKVETVSGSAYRDSQMSKKLAELSIRLTGVPNHPAFVAAMTDPSSPLYERANREVQKDNLGNDILGMTSPVQVKRYGELEETINDAKAALPEGALKDRDFKKALIASGNIAGAYESKPYPKVLERVYQDKFGNVQTNSDNASSSSGQRQDTVSWGGDVWAPDAPPPFNSPAIHTEYRMFIRDNGYVPPEQFVQKYI